MSNHRNQINIIQFIPLFLAKQPKQLTPSQKKKKKKIFETLPSPGLVYASEFLTANIKINPRKISIPQEAALDLFLLIDPKQNFLLQSTLSL